MAQGYPLSVDLLTATSSEAGRAFECVRHGGLWIHFLVVEDPVDCAPPPSSRKLRWFGELVCVLTNQDAARDFSGCNFVDASTVGCV